MTTIASCIDGSAISVSVCDAGAWASQRLDKPLKLLHVLEHSEYPKKGDLSGNIGFSSREHLLEELTELDERRSRLALEHGKHMLEDAEFRANEKGAIDITKLQRHGSLLETLLELEGDTDLFVLGRSGESHEVTAQTLGNHIESVVRSVHQSILIAVQNFSVPDSFMLAYDGSNTTEVALDKVLSSSLLKGLSCHVVMVGKNNAENESLIQKAADRLRTEFDVTYKIVSGEVQEALCHYQKQYEIGLMVMGAYGHSRIRQFFIGSNTTKMISMSDAPLLLLR